MTEEAKEKMEAAWKAQGITMFRPPTPKELREVFEAGFNAGYAADLSSQWVKIEANTPMPQIEDEDWYVTFENAARERYVTLAWYWISRKEWYVSDGDAQIAVPGKVVAFQPQNSPTPFQEEKEDAN